MYCHGNGVLHCSSVLYRDYTDDPIEFGSGLVYLYDDIY